MRAAMQMGFILLKPVPPWRHQLKCSLAVGLQQVEHAARPPPTGAALAVGADRPLVIEEVNRLLQHRFREPQLGVGVAEVVHQGGGVAVVIEQALENPAHRQLQPQVLNGGLLKKGSDRSKARQLRKTGRSHHNSQAAHPSASAISFRFSRAKDDLGFWDGSAGRPRRWIQLL
jgi:hypothetical protein